MSIEKVEINDESFQPVLSDPSDKEALSGKELVGWRNSWRRLKKNKGAFVSLFVLAFIVLLAIFGPHMNSYTYYQTDYSVSFQPPSSEHWLGTDKFGRDQWTRIWEGTRISLYIALLAAVLDLIIGVMFGAISGVFGGKVDLVLQRIIDILVGIPNLIVVILLILFMKPGIVTISVAMVITGWVNMARLVRSQIFKLKTQEYVMASQALGANVFRIIFKHFIPNSMSLILVNLMFTIPSAIFTEAFLSFIGLGLQEPLASLGVLINDGFHAMQSHYYLLIFPSIVIVALMVCFNLLADGLRDAVDPKMKD
ncbi:oligopeptide transport system permease protein [Pullulanibacillus pueri]|uniref:Peptide ABC transporter permease n=1 Tax=Pullulanibacillus pueri TaxID=1437324 RepID=A0A8J2ZXS8_9BACL|nr:ABC transporter permease [Pullulanibacillus pueri]MBM7682860.1 oligopeptide transport system permease protein [Pullulanibacillus pueri]GGH84314.1 peptide ABC transporter permease [Pullulanibacillus pueri]